MAERKSKEILISTPDIINGYTVPNIVEVSVSDGFVWFTREGLTLHWKLSDWDDLVAFVSEFVSDGSPNKEERI